MAALFPLGSCRQVFLVSPYSYNSSTQVLRGSNIYPHSIRKLHTNSSVRLFASYHKSNGGSPATNQRVGSPFKSSRGPFQPSQSSRHPFRGQILQIRSWSDQKPSIAGEKQSNHDPIKQTLERAGETTRAVKDKVKTSLENLTPHENIYNLPNFLTVTRLIAAPATAYLLIHDHNQWALALFVYAGVTDLVDGWLARKWKLQTVAGSVIDPMADKTLMIILTVTLAIKGALPLSLATLILGRDAALAIAAIYYRYASLPTPKTFARYWDFSLPSAEVHPTTVSKYNTFLQLILIGGTLALPVLLGDALWTSPELASSESLDATGNQSAIDSPSSPSSSPPSSSISQAMTAFQCLVAGTTAWSGLSYAFLPNAVTIMGSDAALKAKQGARGRAIIGVTFGSVVLIALALAKRDLDGDKKPEQKTSTTQL